MSINPSYEGVIPKNPTDTDFFLNPVIVPPHLNFIPDRLAEYILGGKSGVSKEDYEDYWQVLAPQKLAIINTLVNNPDAFLLKTKQDELYKSAKFEIQYLDGGKFGGGGCGSGSCSTGIESKSPFSSSPDGKGSLEFNCPACGERNTRPIGGYVYRCQNKNCKNPEAVLPPGLRNKVS